MAKMNKLNYWTTYSILGVMVVAGLLFAGFIYEHNRLASEVSGEAINKDSNSSDKSLAFLKSQQANEVNKNDDANANEWSDIYPNVASMQIAEVTVWASVAETWSERIQGLSGTPYLPEEVVKLFIFDSNGLHSIWMKDMNYAIDIIWVDESGSIVDFAEDATPDSFPESFMPDKPAYYVIETVSGFVDKNKIKVGDKVKFPSGR